MAQPRGLLRRMLAGGALVALLLAVFALYTQPTMMVALSDMVWACFN